MKKILFLAIFSISLNISQGKAQQVEDSIIQKQLIRQKQKLGLTNEQFVSYKIISAEYFNNLGSIAISSNGDTALFNNQARVFQQQKLAALTALLTFQQMELYLLMMPKRD